MRRTTRQSWYLSIDPLCVTAVAMKARITWVYRRGDEAEIIGSINETDFNTWAQARAWIESEIPARAEIDDAHLDYVELDELGDFEDPVTAETSRSRGVAFYKHGPVYPAGSWVWLSRQDR